MPWLAEATLLFNGMAGYHDSYSEQSDEEIDEYISIFSEPGASTAALNWYRAIQDSLLLIDASDPKICLPTLFIYGDREFWVTPDYLQRQRKLIDGHYKELELEAGHWLIQRHPKVIISEVLGQFDRAADQTSGTKRIDC